VPGLAQLVEGRFREIIWYFLAWLLSLLAGLFLYGTGVGLFLIGLAIGLHAWIAIQHRLMKEVADFGARIFCTILALVVVALIYRAVPRVLLPNLTGGYTSLTIPYHNIEAGDYLLARRSRTSAEPLARGSLVLARLAAVRLGERSSASRWTDPMVVQIVGLPGEHVQMENAAFIVNGQELGSEKYPVPRWLRGRRVSVNVGDDFYFVSSQYNVRTHGRQLNDANIGDMCLIRGSNIEALAFMRWLPLSRRGFLREME
jgi:type IV secretory pathway protease TraF